MNKKGFTLIELLAVIAILAIILLIAVPMVLSVLSSSKVNNAKNGARLAWEAAEMWVANQVSSGATLPGTVTVATLKTAGTGTLSTTDTSVSAGTFTITGTNIASVAGLTVNGYTCTAPSNTKASITCS